MIPRDRCCCSDAMQETGPLRSFAPKLEMRARPPGSGAG